MSKFQDKLVADGYCDDRGAGFCARATKLSGKGGYGIVALCVKGHILSLYDVDLKSNIRGLLDTVDLKKLHDLKIRAGIFSQVLKFEYEGAQYSFTDFVGVRPALKVIQEESENR